MIFKFMLLVVTIHFSNCLNIHDITNTTNNLTYVLSPRILLGDFYVATNLTPRFTKNHGCDNHDYAPESDGEVWITHQGYCSIGDIITAARSSKVHRLVLVWTANGDAGYNAKIGAIGLSFSDIQVFEVTQDDGKLFKEGQSIDFLIDDENAWIKFWNSSGLIIWQIILGLLFSSILALSCIKLRLLNKTWEDARKFRMPSFSLGLTAISCIICLLYILVDPMQSRGIYIRPVYLVLLTLYLPCSITTSLFLTWSLLQTFTANNITTVANKLEKTFKVFKILSVVACLCDLGLSLSRGFLYNPELSYVTALPTIFYCITATFMIFLYFYLVMAPHNKHDSGSVGIFKNIREFQMKNLWIFSVCYIGWMISVIHATVYLGTPSTRTPTWVSLTYFFPYFWVGMINMFHVFIIKIPVPAPSLTQLNILDLKFGAAFSSQSTTTSGSI